MNLASLLSPDHIVPELKATEHWPAIEELVDSLEAINAIEPRQKPVILDALREREEKTSTGIGYGVAIPHAFSEKIDKVLTMFGRSSKGVDFGAIDNAPVHFIVLFIVPKDEYQLHLKTLAAIAKMFNNSEIRQQLLDAASTEDILSILSKRPARV